MRACRSLRTAAALVVLALAMVLPASAALAASYSDTPTLTVDQPLVPPCTTVVLTGTGFLPNTLVTITVDGTVVGTVMTDDNGNYTFPYTISCSAVDGEVLTFTGSDDTNTLSVQVTIEAAVTTPTATGTLPKTGSSDTTMWLLRVSIVLVVLGSVVVLATRRTRERADA